MNEQIIKNVRHLISLLVSGEYQKLERLTNGIRLNALQISSAVVSYGRTLKMPPEEGFCLIDVVEVKNANPRCWSVVMPLWTQQEGRSDLTMLLTAVETKGGLEVQLDDIHVL